MLTIAGDGELERARRRIAELGLGVSVEVLGWVAPEDVPGLLERRPRAGAALPQRGPADGGAGGDGPRLVRRGQRHRRHPRSDRRRRAGCWCRPATLTALAAALRRVVSDDAARLGLGAERAGERVRDEFDVAVVSRPLRRPLPRRCCDEPRVGARCGCCIVVPDLGVGGAERHVTTLMPALDRRRFEPSVICIGEEGALFADLEAVDVPAKALHRRKRQAIATLWDLVRELRRAAPDVLIMRGYNAEVLGRVAARIARVPRSVVWVHNHGDTEPRGRLRRVVDRVLDRVTDAYFGVAHAQQDYLVSDLGHPAQKITIVHNGVDPAMFDPTDRPAVRRRARDHRRRAGDRDLGRDASGEGPSAVPAGRGPRPRGDADREIPDRGRRS